ncbi:MAG: hypothetical protein R3F59_08455 [Myxococcota bacterium]
MGGLGGIVMGLTWLGSGCTEVPCKDCGVGEQTDTGRLDSGTTPTTPTSPTTPTTTVPTGDTGPDTPGDTAVATDTGVTPAVPLAGFGTLSGACGELDDGEWLSTDPALFRNTLDLTGLTWDPAQMQLSPGGQQILAEGTLGGSSGESEALAFDVLYRCELAALVLSETHIVYLDAGGKKTDILTGIDGRNVGVSVTRSLTYVDPTERCGPVDPLATEELIVGKLQDLPLSEANASPKNPWERSLLSVIACDDAHADEVEAVWAAADPAVKGDALLVLTVTEGDDAFLYD